MLAACLLPELGLQPSNFCAAVFLGRGYFFVCLVIFTHPSSVAAQFEFFRQSDSTTHHLRGLVGTAQLTSVCCECDVWDLRVLEIPRVYVAYLCLFGDVVEPMRVSAAVCSLQP